MRCESLYQLVMITGLLLATLHECRAMQRRKRSGCDTQESLISATVQGKPNFHTIYTFVNDSNTGVLMTWAGTKNEVILLVTTRSEDHYFYSISYPSSVYTSTDGGQTFQNISPTFGSNVVVRSENGLQSNPVDSNHVLLLTSHNSNLKIWMTTNGGVSWFTTDDLDFDVSTSDPLPLKFNLRYSDANLIPSNANADSIKRWLLARGTNAKLYASLDGGLSWSKVASNVIDALWGGINDSPSAVYVLSDDSGDLRDSRYTPKFGCCTLRKVDLSDTAAAKVVKENVYSFGVFDNYLFTSVWDSSPSGRAVDRRSLQVSSDGGSTFQVVQLPTATPDTFYSVLAVDGNQTFIHVDEPGETGRGVLYVSNGNGIIYSESLDNHFYPDYLAMSDFRPVKSIRGTYLSTAINSDATLYSVISFNRGADWQRLSKPTNVDCSSDDQDKALCGLQITSVYALTNTRSRVMGSLPLSSASAPGILLAHGHTGSSILSDNPDVYLSNDGGYTWRRVLTGPHHYEIAHFGALLVAAPIAGTTKRDDDNNVLHFSLDSGACWHEITFDDDEFIVSGVVTTPGNRQLSVALWGYTSALKWRVHVINFDELLTESCTDNDYETWIPHVPLGKPMNPTDGCLLGSRDTYRRLRADAWCMANETTNLHVTSSVCPCTVDDFDCAYGYYRPTTQSEDCVKHPNITDLEICLNGNLEKIISDGYNKIPGDVCTGGFHANHVDEELLALKQQCDEADKQERSLNSDDDGHVMADVHLDQQRQQEQAQIQQYRNKQNDSVLIVVCVIASVALFAIFILIVIKVRRLRGFARRSSRYARLPHEEDAVRSRLLPISIQADSVVMTNDDDDPLVNVAASTAPSGPDDDVLVNPNNESLMTNGARSVR